eukprot:scaffold6784_cov108-Cylindrotheca_fusiformis.AAC.18
MPEPSKMNNGNQKDSEGSTPGNRKRKPNPNNRRRNTSNGNDKRVCRFYLKGACEKGDACNFLHDDGKAKEDSVDGRKDNVQAPKKKRNNRKPNGNSNSKPESNDVPMPDSPADTGEKKVHITEKRFADLKEICAESRRALAEVFQYEFMTEVQAKTLPVILDSKRRIDVLAKAKTGTGKTLGFLIPAVEQLLRCIKETPRQGSNIGCLVISPTRELAYQIAKEGENLVKFQKSPNLKVVASVGGTNINKDRNVLKKGNVNILVATPGRLLDHLQNADLKLSDRISNLEVLVLDEADQLLDMGFRPDIERILRLLKPSQAARQTLLFSATVPKSVTEIATIAMKKKYEYIDTVGDEEEQTHEHVRQEVMVAPSSNQTSGMGEMQIRAIAGIVGREIELSSKGNPCKIIVFFTTARLTGFMAELFNSASGRTGFPQILEIHSRKSQAIRQRASEKFRGSKDNAILFSSDVSARGMDYPGVTFVLQVGLTEKSQYIHRLGRTARAGKGGRGALLLAPYESKFMTTKVLDEMPLEPVNVPELDSKLGDAITGALEGVDSDKALKESAEQAYRAWLGYYNGQLKKVGWNKLQLVKEGNQWAKDIGLKEQPSLLKKTVGKMGLKGVPGLRLE